LFELLPAGVWQCWQHQVVTKEAVCAMLVAAVVVTVMVIGTFSMV